jgi:hypothetical protein
MERRLRLGDLVDDYCPRERRVTDHAIVAMLGDEIKQTRCTACEAEHAFRGTGGAARRVRRAAPAADAPPLGPTSPLPELPGRLVPASMPRLVAPERPVVAEVIPPAAPDVQARPDEGPVHRQLIRATLPRPEGQPTARPIPQFTVRQGGHRAGGRDEFYGGARSDRAGGNGWTSGPQARSGPGGRPARPTRHGGGSTYGSRPDPQRTDRQAHARRGHPQTGRRANKRSR